MTFKKLFRYFKRDKVEEPLERCGALGSKQDLSEIIYRCNLAWCEEAKGEYSALAIGWLGNSVPTFGKTSVETMAALEYFHKYRWVDEGWLGYHTCEICGQYRDRGEFLITIEGVHYLLPKMILHYIKDHGYLPPQEFISKLNYKWKMESGGLKCSR